MQRILIETIYGAPRLRATHLTSLMFVVSQAMNDANDKRQQQQQKQHGADKTKVQEMSQTQCQLYV
jgi:hypothetical protein